MQLKGYCYSAFGESNDDTFTQCSRERVTLKMLHFQDQYRMLNQGKQEKDLKLESRYACAIIPCDGVFDDQVCNGHIVEPSSHSSVDRFFMKYAMLESKQTIGC